MGIPGGACSETAESVPKQPKEEHSGKREDYKNVTECQQKELICRDSPRSNVQEADLTGQQNEGNDASIDDTAKPEQVINRQGDEAFHPVKGWDEMKRTMNKIERFIELCRDNGKGGYYDVFKDEIKDGRYLLDRSKEELKLYWEQVVEYMEKNPRTHSSQEWHGWLLEGTRFRMTIEPLEIAWCFMEERHDDYLNQQRPKCFEMLQKWQENFQEGNPQPSAGPSNPMEDSCFWAHVEKALLSCRSLIRRGPSVDSEREILRKFEDYVMELINKKAVSTDIFLESSTFMTWWLVYEEILKNQMMGHSYKSPLVGFMSNEPRNNYVNSNFPHH